MFPRYDLYIVVLYYLSLVVIQEYLTLLTTLLGGQVSHTLTLVQVYLEVFRGGQSIGQCLLALLTPELSITLGWLTLLHLVVLLALVFHLSGIEVALSVVSVVVVYLGFE